LYPAYPLWKLPPYEYETEKMPIDILAGSDRLREGLENGEDLDKMEEGWKVQCEKFNKTIREKYLFYE